jgi:hypothetical protein
MDPNLPRSYKALPNLPAWEPASWSYLSTETILSSPFMFNVSPGPPKLATGRMYMSPSRKESGLGGLSWWWIDQQ